MVKTGVIISIYSSRLCQSFVRGCRVNNIVSQVDRGGVFVSFCRSKGARGGFWTVRRLAVVTNGIVNSILNCGARRLSVEGIRGDVGGGQILDGVFCVNDLLFLCIVLNTRSFERARRCIKRVFPSRLGANNVFAGFAERVRRGC